LYSVICFIPCISSYVSLLLFNLYFIYRIPHFAKLISIKFSLTHLFIISICNSNSYWDLFNIIISSAKPYDIPFSFIMSSKSSIYILKSKGDKVDPYKTPLFNSIYWLRFILSPICVFISLYAILRYYLNNAAFSIYIFPYFIFFLFFVLISYDRLSHMLC
jgi:hypothetical protein